MKTQRNDPCPCGSGKKFKHCCGSAEAFEKQREQGHAGAVERALDWLAARHREATAAEIEAMLFEGLSEEERNALQQADDETWEQLQRNAFEWLLAEGAIGEGAARTRVMDVLLGKGGPLFTVGQRAWLEQLGRIPLRLYHVTDVVPAVQITLCDAVRMDAAPIVVADRLASDETLIGEYIALRVLRFDDRWELSGATYAFSRLAGPRLVASMRDARSQSDGTAADLSALIRRHWRAQFVAATAPPTIVDASTGETLLLITDHYRVRDWPGVVGALQGERDVQGDEQHGWSRVDAEMRPLLSVNRQSSNRVSVFYRTRTLADRGRPWFERLAGDAVQFLSRELSDPKGALAKANPRESTASTRQHELPPEALSEVVEAVVRRSYANWADEPIPALGGKTPREMIATPAGVERVKGLLRSYEAGEKKQARQQGRRAVSYDFLWQALGLER